MLLTPRFPARPASGLLRSRLPIVLLLVASTGCVDQKDDEVLDTTLLPVNGLEMGEQLLLELEIPLEAGETVTWRQDVDTFGTLEQLPGDPTATFTAGSTEVTFDDGFFIFADVTGGAEDRMESKQIIIDAPIFAEARPYQFAGGDDYQITGSSIDLVGDTLLVGHSADRLFDDGFEEVRIGKYASLARYIADDDGTRYEAGFLPALSVIRSVALERTTLLGAGSDEPDIFALVQEPGQPAELRRYSDAFDVVWSEAEDTLEFLSSIATSSTSVYMAVLDGQEVGVVRRGLDGTQGGAPLDLEADTVHGLTATDDQLYILVERAGAVSVLVVDADLDDSTLFDFATMLPADVRGISGPDDKGRLVVCGGDRWHLISPIGEVVYSVASPPVEGSTEGLTDIAVEGGRVRLYQRRQGAVAGEAFIAELVEAEAQEPIRPVRLVPAGTILNVGRSREFSILDINNVPVTGFTPEATNAGRVQDLGNGRFRVTAGGLLGTWPFAFTDGTRRVSGYVSVNAFNFGFVAPVPGPGAPSHDTRVAMASSDEFLVFAYSNPQNNVSGSGYVHRIPWSELFCEDADGVSDLCPGVTQMAGERLQGALTYFEVEDPDVTANIAASPSGIAYWIDKYEATPGGEQRLQFKRWRPGQSPEVYPMGSDPNTGALVPNLRDEFRALPDVQPFNQLPGWITAGAPAADAPLGTEASLYWVRRPVADVDEFVLYRVDVPVDIPGTEIDLTGGPFAFEILRTTLAEIPTDLAINSDGSLITQTGGSSRLGRLTPLGGGGYDYDPNWVDVGNFFTSAEEVRTVTVGLADLIYVNAFDPFGGGTTLLVLDSDGVPVEGGEISAYQPTPGSDFGQMQLEDVREVAVDRAEGRIRLFDKVTTSSPTGGDVAILGVQLDAR